MGNEAFNILVKKHILKIFSTNYGLLKALYDKDYCLRELADALYMDEGNLSRRISQLEELELVWVYMKEGGRGRPERRIQLTPLTKNLLNAIDGVIKE